jgi:hypothetical protein
MGFLSNVTGANSNALTATHPMSAFSHPRASYCNLSRNTSTVSYTAVFYDAEFNKIGSATHQSLNGNTGGFQSQSDTYENLEQFMYNINPTQSTPSSSGTSNYINATNVMGEFGNGMINASERGTLSGFYSRWRTTSSSNVGRQRHAFVNSDHSNKNKVIMFDGGYLESMPMWMPLTTSTFGNYPTGERKSKQFTANSTLGANTSNLTSQFGTASYNNVRKELVIVANNSSSNSQFYINIFKNVDFDATDCDVTQVSSTPSNQFLVTLGNWQTSGSESRYNFNVVLTDNGQIYITVMHPSNQFNIHRITRAAGDASGTVENLASQSLTTSYGIEQGNEYGQNAIQTRNGTMVMGFSPYYYYGAGIRSYVIDKRNNSYAAGYEDTSSSTGYQPMKYRDDSFCYYFAGNFYASNWTGAYIRGTTSSRAGSTPVTQTNVIYLPTAPGPNTTNYPGMTPVWEFNLQSILPGSGGF